MKKYSEITLSDDERKLLEVFRSKGFEKVTRLKYEICYMFHGYTYDKNVFIGENVGFDWMEFNEPYDISKLLNPPHEPKTVWELKPDDPYWTLSTCGTRIGAWWKGGKYDDKCRSQGHVFLTEEEAKFEAKRREITTILKKHSRPFVSGKENYCIAFSKEENSIEFPWQDDYQYNDLYFDDEVTIGEAIEEVGNGDYNKGEELVIKYYLGVNNNEQSIRKA